MTTLPKEFTILHAKTSNMTEFKYLLLEELRCTAE